MRYVSSMSRAAKAPTNPAQRSALALAGGLFLLLAGCSGGGASVPPPASGAGPAPPAAQSAAPPATPVPVRVSEVARGLKTPWGVAFLPDGAMLVTERDGGLKLVRQGSAPADVPGLPAAFRAGQAGNFDIALHPRFAENGLVYVTMATGTSSANRLTLVRGRFDGTRLQDVRTLFQAAPDRGGSNHYGGRLRFMPDETIMLTTGDAYTLMREAQTLNNHLGKVLRLDAEGRAPAGNPFVGRAGALPEIWSYGHRNVQGLAFDPGAQVVYTNEHGPRGGDEINLIQPGQNYGWPVVTNGIDYSGAPIALKASDPAMRDPLVDWTPSIAPSGMAFYAGIAIPQWRGDLLVTTLAGQELRRVDLEGGQVRGQERIVPQIAERLRQVAQAPDGSVIVLTDNGSDGKVLRIAPAP
jgi:aldose sugar dehydrogenase